MLGFIYLVMILCWILVVLFLKCRKILKPHFMLSDNYNENTQTRERQASVHVIELSAEDLENEQQQMEAYHQQHHMNTRRYSNRSNCSSAAGERMMDTTYPIDAVINPVYANDDTYIINAPPPSYDEVMRQPEVYPKIHKRNEENI